MRRSPVRLLIFALAITLSLAACGSSNSSSSAAGSSSSTSSTLVDARAILPPAKIKPVVDECSQALTDGEDGTVAPLSCNENTQVNVQAWTQMASVTPQLFGAGPTATAQDVTKDMCADIDDASTIPIETDAYHLAVLYYGWKFNGDLSEGLVAGACG